MKLNWKRGLVRVGLIYAAATVPWIVWSAVVDADERRQDCPLTWVRSAADLREDQRWQDFGIVQERMAQCLAQPGAVRKGDVRALMGAEATAFLDKDTRPIIVCDPAEFTPRRPPITEPKTMTRTPEAARQCFWEPFYFPRSERAVSVSLGIPIVLALLGVLGLLAGKLGRWVFRGFRD